MPLSPLGSIPGVRDTWLGHYHIPGIDPELSKRHIPGLEGTEGRVLAPVKNPGEAKQSCETPDGVRAQEPGTALSWAEHSSEAEDGKSLSGAALLGFGLGFEGFDGTG